MTPYCLNIAHAEGISVAQCMSSSSLLGAVYLERLFGLRLDGWQVGIHAGHSLHSTSPSKLKVRWNSATGTTSLVT